MSATEIETGHIKSPDAAASIFNPAHYSQQLDRMVNLSEGLADYRNRGEAAGLSPHPLFLPSHVAAQLGGETAAATGGCILDAYLERAANGVLIDPHPLFDAARYRALAGPFRNGQTPLGHYVATLAAGSVPPSPTLLFDRAHYGTIENHLCNLLHFMKHGASERRSPHPLFTPNTFISACSQVGIQVGKDTNPLLAYLTDRRLWAVPTHILFDPAHYAQALQKLGLPLWRDEPPLLHFLRQRQDVGTHFAFDPVFYRRHAAALGIELRAAPILHHVRNGGLTGAMPHRLFSPAHYVATNADVQTKRLDPLVHFVRHGCAEMRNPHPLMSLRSIPVSGVEHTDQPTDRFRFYLETGGTTLVNPHPMFDAALYAAGHPECLQPGETPLGHYAGAWLEAGVFCPPWGTALLERRPARGRPERIDLIVVSHELTRTGAPLILLALIREFVGRLGLGCLVITQRGGVLLEAFREWAPVIDLTMVRDPALKQEQFLLSCVQAFEGPARPRAVLVNTACVSTVGRTLAEAGLPVITLVHELAAAFDRTAFETIYQSSSAVIYPASYVLREAHMTYTLPVEKAAVLPQGLLDPAFGGGDRDAARRAVLDMLDAPDDAFIVLGCGTLDLRKGIDLFARAAAASIAAQEADDPAGPARPQRKPPARPQRKPQGQLPGRLPERPPERPPGRPLYFLWVGGGLTNRHSVFWFVQQDVARAGLTGRIHFAGPHTGTEPFFLASDAFLLTSRMDPFPCVVHEAMACGLPVIAFENAGGAPEALGSEAGIVVPYGDTAAIAASLVRLASDPREAAALGERARARVREQYSFAAYADAVIDAFSDRAGVKLGAPKSLAPAGLSRSARGRVIFTLPEARRNAEGRSVAALIGALTERGFDAELILTAPRADPATMAGLEGVPRRLLALSMARPADPGFVAEALGGVLAAAAPVVLVHGSDETVAALAAQLPARVGILGLVTQETPGTLEQAMRLGRFWQRSVVASEAARARLLEKVPALVGKCEVIPPGFRLAPVPRKSEAGRPVQLLCLLPLTPVDGGNRSVASLIDALADTDSVLTLIGGAADMRAFAALFAGEVSARRLLLLTSPDEGELRAALHAAEILIVFDDIADAAAGIAEALGAGLAVIDAVGRSDAPRLNRNGEAGIVVPRGNARAVARAVSALAADRERLLACRLHAQELARTHFISAEENIDRTADLLDRMLEELRGASEQKEVVLF